MYYLHAKCVEDVVWTLGTLLLVVWLYLKVDDMQQTGYPIRYIGFTIRQHRIGTHDYGTYTCHAFGEQLEVMKEVQLKKLGRSSLYVGNR